VSTSPDKTGLLADARRDLPAFYSRATPDDAALMDALVTVHAAVDAGRDIPRALLPSAVRFGVEKTGAAVAKSFADLREAVRGCQTYRSLDAVVQTEVERIAFTVKLPPSN
jgi:hypothetical protein